MQYQLNFKKYTWAIIYSKIYKESWEILLFLIRNFKNSTKPETFVFLVD